MCISHGIPRFVVKSTQSWYSPSQPNDYRILSENGIKVLFLYDRNNEVFVAFLLKIAAIRNNLLLLLLCEGIDQYVGEQIAKLVGYDVVLLR